MEKAKLVFAVLGITWVVSIIFAHIFPRIWLTWIAYNANVWFNLSGALHGSKESVIWLAFSVAPACLILLVLLAGIGARSVVLWGIRKARG